jgi:hypothetical protein
MCIWRDALNATAQLVLNAGVLGLSSGQTHVTRQDANAHCFANWQSSIAHPYATAVKINA